MTTCRSEIRLVLLLALAAGSVPAAWAQDPARPATHTVRRGDTLWDLAAQYLGDPFLWPQIYRLNTDVVEDPHWIYPGEVLRLVADADTRAVPGEPEPVEPVEWTEEGALFPRRPRAEIGSTLLAITDDSYRALSQGDFHSSGFMTEGESLPYGRFIGNAEPMQIRVMGQRSFTLLNDVVTVQPPAGATYRAGDTLLVLALMEGLPGERQWGHIVRPTGLVEVGEGSEGGLTARVLAIYGEMRDGQYVLPAERFISPGTARARPVSTGLTGHVIMPREGNPVRHPQDILFLDVGRRSGVALGDHFEVLRETPGGAMAEERIATVQVVHLREGTSTVRVLTLTASDFPFRALVRQIASLGN
jgi:LysM repeat protein